MRHIFVLAHYFLAIDKVLINLYDIEKKVEKNLISFLYSLNNFNFQLQKKIDAKIFKENLLVILSPNSKSLSIKSIIKIIKKENILKTAFFIHSSSSFDFNNNHLQTFKYPIHINKLTEQLLFFYSNKSFFYKYLLLAPNGELVSKKNNKRVFLTEIESHLIKFLFQNKKI